MPNQIYDIIIVGGGPAGITAGIYSSRKQLKTLFLTKDFIGQVGKTGEIDNWPGSAGVSGIELTGTFEKHLRKFENNKILTILQNIVTEIYVLPEDRTIFSASTESGKEFRGKALIIATGRKPKLLGVKGEKEFNGKGVSYCSICDAPFFKDKTVVVAGGGNAGFETALDLAKYAQKVIIFEHSDSVVADEALQTRVSKREKISIQVSSAIEQIKGDKLVESVIYKNLVSDKIEEIPADGVFVAIGSVPTSSFLKEVVKLNDREEIVVDPITMVTSVNGIFAAGDVTNMLYKQIVTSAGRGCQAALSAYDYLKKQSLN